MLDMLNFKVTSDIQQGHANLIKITFLKETGHIYNDFKVRIKLSKKETRDIIRARNHTDIDRQAYTFTYF